MAEGGLSLELYKLLAAYDEVSSTRYLVPRLRIPKSTDWILRVLPQLSDERFRTYTRMGRRSFGVICSMIEDHPVFLNQSSSKQTPVYNQLLVAIWKLANDGSSSSVRPIASIHGVSEGHVVNCVSRVVTALFDIRTHHVKWPSERQRVMESLHNEQKSGLRGVVGSVDGSDIVLHDKPCMSIPV
jgi:hypothetical protein